jgi:ferrous iron transport protein B
MGDGPEDHGSHWGGRMRRFLGRRHGEEGRSSASVPAVRRILLVGNPNVGKSAIFSRLTGVHVIASNYPGTTVGFTRGHMKLGGRKVEVTDVPGAYTLEPTCKAEEIVVKMLQEGDLVINVVDATNLERNLYLTTQLLERDIPAIIALNVWDEAKHKGIEIDEQMLEQLLGIPVVPTVAITGEGMTRLVSRLGEARVVELKRRDPDERWAEMGRIVRSVQVITHRHHTLLDRLSEASITPLSGIPIAVGVLFGCFHLVRLIGEGLTGSVLEPIFNGLYLPLVTRLSLILGGEEILHKILVGELIEGQIDWVQSMGVLTTGVFVPLGMVLPYVFAFYLLLSLLEDFGYLPRLAVLLDTVMHRLGLHGYAIVPMLLGLGCNVPGILATRILESRRERFIAATLISIGIPCAALQAMILGLVGRQGTRWVLVVYGTLFLVWFGLGRILNLLVKGFSPTLLMEIPPYRIPSVRLSMKKVWMRVYAFLIEAIPVVLFGVFVINLLYIAGVFNMLASLTSPLIINVLGLPEEAVVALLIGFLRKDVAVGLLGPLGLSAKQLVIGATVLAMFFPCIATFAVFVKELGWKLMLIAAGIMIAVSVGVGGLQNLVLR